MPPAFSAISGVARLQGRWPAARDGNGKKTNKTQGFMIKNPGFIMSGFFED
jgi:hypothetical protein